VESTGLVPDLVILDGNHDWLTPPDEVGLLAFAHEGSPTVPPVTTMIKADMKCSSVAAASVIAKVERDSMMVSLDAEHPQYGWAVNKGYAAPEHMLALEAHGPCVLHRRSWRLPGMPSLEELLAGGVVELSDLDVRDMGESDQLPDTSVG
jgi:ribonuclease HII